MKPWNLPLLLDGATGTRLQRAGMPRGACSEQWVLEHPETLLAVQHGYVAAGTEALLAPTFGANPLALAKYGITDAADYNRRLLALSREAAAGGALVAADLAPTGHLIAPYGDSSVEQLYESYLVQTTALEQAGVDFWVIETMMALPEARAALLAVRAVSDKPVLVTFTLEENGRTLTGGSPISALLTLQTMGADAFGFNCSAGPDSLLTQIETLTPFAKVPLAAKPNAGLPEFVEGETVFRMPPEEFVRCVPALAAAGVRLFGGCCGTDERHIAALAQALAAQDFPPLTPAAGEWLCSERERLPLDALRYETVACDDDLEDTLLDAEGEPRCIELNGAADLDCLAESIHAATGLLGFAAADPTLLEPALRLYNGRAFVCGELPPELARTYGALAVD